MLVIAVHGGAGTHSINKDAEILIRKGLKEACAFGQRSFQANQDACQAIRDSIVAMEDNHHFNAGTGSNLTIAGTVECDASIMNSAEDFGAIGATSGIKNPIKAAYRILVESQRTDPHGRIPPMLVSGNTPSDLAVDPSEMITHKARSEWERWRAVIQTEQQSNEITCDTIVQDTVGAIISTIDGEVSAGVSSGGILLKPTGRIGEAACFGAGCWASAARGSLNAVACSISGAGEMVMRAFLAKELADSVRRPDCDVHEEIERILNRFIDMCTQRGATRMELLGFRSRICNVNRQLTEVRHTEKVKSGFGKTRNLYYITASRLGVYYVHIFTSIQLSTVDPIQQPDCSKIPNKFLVM
ncbi:hypothetical protein OPQ81_005662 [Rhizoctonia solani]|nr:hypothetical protein OPQ81_005662 [Rhizoctonia solani]